MESIMRKLALIGAGGHGKVLANIAKKMGYEKIIFFDDCKSEKEGYPYPIVGRICEAETCDCEVAVAIGDAKIRQKLLEELEQKAIKIPTLIHPNAIIAEDVEIGKGAVIMAGVVLQPGCKIGKGCIINTCASVDHDSKVGDYVHVAVGVHLAGNVKVEARTWIGAGATISDHVCICSDCIIGAGAVVVKDITEMGTFIGVPARRKTF